MKKLPKILLITSVLSFAAGLTGPGSEVWIGILKPLGALMFVAAFIVYVVSSLDPEQYAADQELRSKLLQQPEPPEPLPLPALAKVAA